MQYIDRIPQENNAYAEFGTHCHGILERWAKGDLMSFELADAYETEYAAAVRHYFPPFPKGLAGKYFEEGKAYFERFDGFGDAEILSVEERFEIDICGHPFVGVADLVLREKDGGITIIDHKSKSMQTMKKELALYKRQLYLYAAYAKQRFGEYPKLLRFNMFRYDTFVDEPFNMVAYKETLRWVDETIRSIRAETDWLVSESGYFCRWICSVNRHCPVGETIMNSGRTR